MLHSLVEHPTLEGRISALHGEVQDLRALLDKAIEHLPKPGTRNASSSQLAAEIGVSKRTLIRWVEEGRMDAGCYVTKKRGSQFQYVFDRQKAIVCAEQIQRGER